MAEVLVLVQILLWRKIVIYGGGVGLSDRHHPSRRYNNARMSTQARTHSSPHWPLDEARLASHFDIRTSYWRGGVATSPLTLLPY